MSTTIHNFSISAVTDIDRPTMQEARLHSLMRDINALCATPYYKDLNAYVVGGTGTDEDEAQRATKEQR